MCSYMGQMIIDLVSIKIVCGWVEIVNSLVRLHEMEGLLLANNNLQSNIVLFTFVPPKATQVYLFIQNKITVNHKIHLTFA